jgi:hypothetical protein
MVDVPIKSFVVRAFYDISVADSAATQDLLSSLREQGPILVKSADGKIVEMRCPYFDFESGIQESVAAEYAAIAILGRAQGVRSFVATNNRDFPLSLRFMYQGSTSAGSAASDAFVRTVARVGTSFSLEDSRVINRAAASVRRAADISQQVVTPSRWLESLAFPQVDAQSGRSYPPPRVEIQFGDLMRTRAVLQSCAIRWYGGVDYDAAHNIGSLLPYCSEVSCHFIEVSDVNAKTGTLNIAGIYA